MHAVHLASVFFTLWSCRPGRHIWRPMQYVRCVDTTYCVPLSITASQTFHIYIYELGVCFAAPISRLRTADGGHVDALCCSALCLFPESLTTVLRNMRWPLNMCRALILRVCRWLTCTPKWVSCVQKSRCQCRRARSGGGH